MTARTILDQAWTDLEQSIVLAAQDDEPHDAGPMIQKLRDLVTSERMAITVEGQVVAFRFAAEGLSRFADDVASGARVL